MKFVGVLFSVWALIMLIVERPEMAEAFRAWLGLEGLWKLAWHPGAWAMAQAIGEIVQAMATLAISVR